MTLAEACSLIENLMRIPEENAVRLRAPHNPMEFGYDSPDEWHDKEIEAWDAGEKLLSILSPLSEDLPLAEELTELVTAWVTKYERILTTRRDLKSQNS